MSEILNKITLFAGNFAPESWQYFGDDTVMTEDDNEIRYIIQKQSSSHGEDTLIGQIMLFAGDFAPKNWAFCDGNLMEINKNGAL